MIICASRVYDYFTIILIMNTTTIQTQQHSLSTIQVAREPVKEVKNLLPQTTAEDLMGLTWALCEEEY